MAKEKELIKNIDFYMNGFEDGYKQDRRADERK